MPGASDQTQPVKILNANWIPDSSGGDGQFEMMIITEDEHRYTMATTPSSVAAIVALAKADTVLLWDPINQTLIAANVVGEMPWTKNELKPTATT